MNFKEWLKTTAEDWEGTFPNAEQQWLEGKAPSISASMLQYANIVATKISSGNYKFGYVVHEADIDNGVEIKKNVPTIINQPKTNSPLASYNPITKVIQVFLYPDVDREKLESAIEHELVHLFDRKLSDPNLRFAKWVANNMNPQQTGNSYLNSPWEVDAFMSQRASLLVKKALSQFNDYPPEQKKQIMKQRIATLTPSIEIEELWYSRPKLWRKYINTIYNVFQKNGLID